MTNDFVHFTRIEVLIRPEWVNSLVCVISVDNYMEDIASDLLRKKDRMMDKFRILMLQESMVSCSAVL